MNYNTATGAGRSSRSAYAVREVGSVDRKHLRRMTERHDAGTPEIKVRGIDIAPESLWDRSKPGGQEPATLPIVGGPGPDRPGPC